MQCCELETRHLQLGGGRLLPLQPCSQEQPADESGRYPCSWCDSQRPASRQFDSKGRRQCSPLGLWSHPDRSERARVPARAWLHPRHLCSSVETMSVEVIWAHKEFCHRWQALGQHLAFPSSCKLDMHNATPITLWAVADCWCQLLAGRLWSCLSDEMKGGLHRGLIASMWIDLGIWFTPPVPLFACQVETDLARFKQNLRTSALNRKNFSREIDLEVYEHPCTSGERPDVSDHYTAETVGPFRPHLAVHEFKTGWVIFLEGILHLVKLIEDHVRVSSHQMLGTPAMNGFFLL